MPIRILAPIHNPLRNRIIRVVTGLHIPTAARASFPTKCPTIILSTGIVSQLKRLPSTSGIVNFTSIGMILPVVKSFVILNFLLLSFEIVKHILCIKIYESQEKQTKLRILEINSRFSYNSYLTCRNYL